MSPSISIPSIGIIKTPFNSLENMPIQPKGASVTFAELIIDEAYTAGLKDLIGFSHIYLIYHFNKATKVSLEVTPFMDTKPHGVFATRSPLRPSHIGLSVTKIHTIEGNVIKVEGIDILNGTPLLDIKPYIPQFDSVENVSTGWMDKNEEAVIAMTSDERFV